MALNAHAERHLKQVASSLGKILDVQIWNKASVNSWWSIHITDGLYVGHVEKRAV